MITLPPAPSSPPSGPPLGPYFSRRKLTQPLPPRPPWISICTRSTNIEKSTKNKKRTLPQSESVPASCTANSKLVRGSQHVYAAAFLVELDGPVHQGEQSVVLAAADVPAGVKHGADLPHDD